jgi:hypothetical protein
VRPSKKSREHNRLGGVTYGLDTVRRYSDFPCRLYINGSNSGWGSNFSSPQCPSSSHHHRLYSPGLALASSSKFRQRPLSCTSARQFLQPNFLESSSTPSIHFDIGQLRPLDPQRVHSIVFGKWGPSSVIINGYRKPFPGVSGRGVRRTT